MPLLAHVMAPNSLDFRYKMLSLPPNLRKLKSLPEKSECRRPRCRNEREPGESFCSIHRVGTKGKRKPSCLVCNSNDHTPMDCPVINGSAV